MTVRPPEFSVPFGVINLKGLMTTHEVTPNNSNTIKNAVVDQPIFAHESYPIIVTLDSNWKSDFGIMTYKSSSSYTGKKYQTLYHKHVLWDFGDGTVVHGYTAEHYYKLPGKYTITCTFFDINRLGVKNGYEVTVIVKQILPTAIAFDVNESNIDTLKCSSISKIARIEATLSNNVKEAVSIKAKRIYPDGITEESSWDDVKSDPYPHLKKYWCFLKAEYEYYYNSEKVFDERYVPSDIFDPSYEDLYGYFELTSSKEINFKCFRIQPYLTTDNIPDIKIHNPNASIASNEVFSTYPIITLSSISELPKDAAYIGKRGYVDIFYRSDFINNKNIVSFSLDVDNINIYNSIASSKNFLNIPPLGLHFSIVGNSRDEVLYTLSLNGFVTSFEPVDKLVQLTLIRDYTFPAVIVPYILSDFNGYYIPKDIDFSATQVQIVNGIYNDSIIRYIQSQNNIPFVRSLEIECHNTINMTLKMQDYFYGIEVNYPLKDLDNLVIPMEQYYNQNAARLVNAYTPHRLFQSTPRLKKALTDFFANDRMLDYVVTKGYHFFDDTTNIKTNYVSFLIQTLHMLNIDVYEYDQTNLDGVNELRDFVRILSMNHTDLMGNYINENYDIKYRPLTKGKHIGDALLVSDRIFLDYKNRVFRVERDGKSYNISNPNEYIVVVDNYTYASKLVNFLDWMLDEDQINELSGILLSDPLNRVAASVETYLSQTQEENLSYVRVDATNVDTSSIDLMYPLYLSLWEEIDGVYTKIAVSTNPVRVEKNPNNPLTWAFEEQTINPKLHTFKVRWLIDPMDQWDIVNNKYQQYSICIGTWYNAHRNWGLILPDNTFDVPEDTPKVIASYYSFFLLIPNSEKVHISAFLDQNTITDEMRDKDKWNDIYGITYDVLEKIIFNALQLKSAKLSSETVEG